MTRPRLRSWSPISGLRSLAAPAAVCWLMVLLFALFFGALAVQQHRTFQTNGLDLGNVDQALWNTAHGRFLNFTLMAPVQSRLALHVEPILLLAVPFYWLGLGRPELLLVVQAAVVALGAWPLYQLATDRLAGSGQPPGANRPGEAPWLALAFPLAYLLLPTLEAAVLFDFHAVTLVPTWLLFAFLALERDRPRRFLVFAVLAMAGKEDMPLVIAMLALYAGLARRQWRLAGLTLGLSAAWFAVVVGLVQPAFAPGGNIQLNRYAWLGDSPAAMLQTVLGRPDLVFDHLWREVNGPTYLFRLFLPTAFLALFSPLTLLPMLPALAVNLLSDNPFTWRLEDFHYGAPLAPFLFISALYGLTWLSRRLEGWTAFLHRRKMEPQPAFAPANLPVPPAATLSRPSSNPSLALLILLLLACSLVYHYYRGFTPLARPFAWPQVTAHDRLLDEIIGSVPGEAALFAQSNLAPHLAHRPVLYGDFSYFTDPAFPAPVPVDEVLLDVTTLENSGGLHQFLRRVLLESGDYQLVTARDGILRLRRPAGPAAPVAALPADFYTFAQPDTPPDYDLLLDFGNLIRLHGYSLHFNREEEVQVSVDLALLRAPQANSGVQPVLYLLDAADQPLGATTDPQPLLAWFPLEAWPVGRTVHVRFNTLPWPGYSRQGLPYHLALGLVDGADPWASPRYRPAVVRPTPVAPRLAADGTLVELAAFAPQWGIPTGGPFLRQFTRPTPPRPLAADFNNQLQLLGYAPPRVSRGQTPTLIVTLYWQAVTTPPSVTRFVQLVGPAGRLYGQDDAAPANGQYPTGLWQPGEVVVETVTLALPAHRPPGPYRLHVGFYHPDTGQRLPLTSGDDHVEIPVEE